MSAVETVTVSQDPIVLTLRIAGQVCAIPVSMIRDVLAEQRIARIPLSPSEVAGNLNLRGRIVTAIDLRRRLQLKEAGADDRCMLVVTEQGSDLYALVVDEVRDVLTLRDEDIKPNPPNLPPPWSEYSTGIYQLPQDLLVVLDVEKLLRIEWKAAA